MKEFGIADRSDRQILSEHHFDPFQFAASPRGTAHFNRLV